MLETLTDFEQVGLSIHLCLADGHAYQDLHPCFEKIIAALPQIWHAAANRSVPDAEQRFHLSFSSLIRSPALANFTNFKICPTASNSIDLIAAMVNRLHLKTVLIEPTFDNLALLMKRRGVNLSAVSDKQLYLAAELDVIDYMLPELKKYGALFLVHPNNPTGNELSQKAFNNIVCFCEKNGILIIIDNCFRLYRKDTYCDYSRLIQSSASWITFEDTGKVWPTQDLKASLVYYSDDLRSIFYELYNEIYLCISNFSLEILSAFFDETSKAGIQKTIWETVKTRRALLRKTIGQSILSVSSESFHSNLPVEWLVCNAAETDDFSICRDLQQLRLAILPGRQFYWNSYGKSQNHKNVRVSMMKPKNMFLQGLDILQKYCEKNYAALKTAVNRQGNLCSSCLLQEADTVQSILLP